ncbi:hypothetical protein [Rubripirellula reticaptiva]|uniref:Uncharacterized protein n=1 Tax=Rubripirellula reticaptiva TaxID=2528013 RepID=A0A5C6FAJ8_9BACT|nr:hypothetical protein [Rubripirellula reticaptiva]TWU57246.1 hypothetical protein Poly59_01530 [Rubripirellula reticaptiva]
MKASPSRRVPYGFVVIRRATWLSLMLVATTVTAIEPTKSIGPLAANGPQLDRTLPTDANQLAGESEAAVLLLVQSHLPQLAGMLDRLRDANPRQYERAIRDLSRWVKRLESAKKRDSKLHGIEVDLLKAETNVDLLSAKLKVRDDASDRNLLRDAVDQLHQAKTARVRYDVQLAADRLDRAKQQLQSANQKLKMLEDSTEADRQHAYVGLLRKSGRRP